MTPFFEAILIFIFTYVWLATERTPRHWVVLAGVLALCLGRVITPAEAVHLIEWKTIVWLLGMFVAVEVLAYFGLFDVLADHALIRLSARPGLIFLVLPLVTGVLSMVVNNITVMVFMAPITLRLCRGLKQEPGPLIVAEAACANMLGAATLSGAPPNLVMASMLHYGFKSVTLHMSPIALAATLIYLLVRQATPHRATLPVDEPLPKGGHLDYETLIFFAGLFILTGALQKVGLFEKLAFHLTAIENPLLLALSLLWASAFVSAVVDNVPMAMAMAYCLNDLSRMRPGLPTELLVWATLAGLSFGGNMTPIGASPNVVAYGILNKQGIRLGWSKWASLTVPATVAALAVTSAILYAGYRTGFY